MQLKEKLNYGEFKELYTKEHHLIPTGFRYYKDSVLTYQEWVNLIDIFLDLKDAERCEIIDAAKKALAEETLYGVWSKY